MGDAKECSGRCLCGSVKVTVTVENSYVDACHCSMCRKWSGGPMLAVDGSGNVHFEGKSDIAVYNSSDWADRGFCRNCGTHLFFRLKKEEHYALPVGLLDGEQPWEFRNQIFVDEKPAFYSFANDTHNMTAAEVIAEYGAPE